MTDAVSHPVSLGTAVAGPARAPRSLASHLRARQAGLLAVAAASALSGWLLSAGAAAPDLLQADAELAMLLRFMAIVKAALALAALGVTVWRFGHPVATGAGLLYLAGAALMTAGPGVIWHLDHVAAGAGLFHAGLLAWLAALLADRGGVAAVLRHAPGRDRAA